MRRTRVMLFSLLAFVFLVSPLTQWAQGESEGTVIKLSKNIYRIMFYFSVPVNLVLFTGQDGILLVDTGEKDTSESLKSIVKKHGPGGIKYIINTHLHEDHTGGNEALGKKAIIMNSADLARWVKQGVISPGKGGLKGRTGKTFNSYYCLKFNGEDIYIIPAAGGHSGEDMIVYFKDSGIVQMGDLLFSGSFPLIIGDLDKYQEILEKVVDIYPTNAKFIAGHGKNYTMADMNNYYKMIIDTRKIIEKELKAGKSLQAVKDAKLLKKWESYGNTFPLMTTNDWIDVIYQAYLQKK